MALVSALLDTGRDYAADAVYSGEIDAESGVSVVERDIDCGIGDFDIDFYCSKDSDTVGRVEKTVMVGCQLLSPVNG